MKTELLYLAFVTAFTGLLWVPTTNNPRTPPILTPNAKHQAAPLGARLHALVMRHLACRNVLGECAKVLTIRRADAIFGSALAAITTCRLPSCSRPCIP